MGPVYQDQLAALREQTLREQNQCALREARTETSRAKAEGEVLRAEAQRLMQNAAEWKFHIDKQRTELTQVVASTDPVKATMASSASRAPSSPLAVWAEPLAVDSVSPVPIEEPIPVEVPTRMDTS